MKSFFFLLLACGMTTAAAGAPVAWQGLDWRVDQGGKNVMLEVNEQDELVVTFQEKGELHLSASLSGWPDRPTRDRGKASVSVSWSFDRIVDATPFMVNLFLHDHQATGPGNQGDARCEFGTIYGQAAVTGEADAMNFGRAKFTDGQAVRWAPLVKTPEDYTEAAGRPHRFVIEKTADGKLRADLDGVERESAFLERVFGGDWGFDQVLLRVMGPLSALSNVVPAGTVVRFHAFEFRTDGGSGPSASPTAEGPDVVNGETGDPVATAAAWWRSLSAVHVVLGVIAILGALFAAGAVGYWLGRRSVGW